MHMPSAARPPVRACVRACLVCRGPLTPIRDVSKTHVWDTRHGDSAAAPDSWVEAAPKASTKTACGPARRWMAVWALLISLGDGGQIQCSGRLTIEE